MCWREKQSEGASPYDLFITRQLTVKMRRLSQMHAVKLQQEHDSVSIKAISDFLTPSVGSWTNYNTDLYNSASPDTDRKLTGSAEMIHAFAEAATSQ